MTAFLIANMAPLMFAALVVFLLLGYPVAFALAAIGIVFGLIGIELGCCQPALLQALPERIWGDHVERHAARDPVLHVHGADPRANAGMAEDLLDTIGQLFGPLRGGLAYAVIFVGALLAATTGVGRGVGDRDGADLAADHAALRVRQALRDRRDRGVGHARADHPAVARADHHGRPARPLGRRHVRRRVHPGHRARRRCMPAFTLARQRRQAAVGAGAARAEARTLREPDGSCGQCRRWHRARSCIADRRRRRVLADRYCNAAPRRAIDERIDRARSCVGTAIAFVAALLGKLLQAAACCRGSPSAAIVRADSAAGAHLPRARHDLPRRARRRPRAARWARPAR